ncbi:hypothetical protein H632_c241p0 [Helicosporidium sp. ATCC 50920]|nr:hypothetical protein H632_c241p0 [Helicosporidium sp. ATCC 50920]|eukprot:KDD76397.1 hypothetical protein H632_c241p0 [Helicosporidium sp. ATCC 50920]
MTATETFTAEGGTVTDPAPQTESSLLSSDERDGSPATGKEASDTELRGDQRSSKSYGPFEVRMLCPLKLIGGFIGKARSPGG